MVGIAKQGRLIAGAAGLQRDISVTGIHWRPVDANPVVHKIEPGIERSPRWTARRRLGVVPGKASGVVGEGVDIRGPRVRVPQQGKAIAAPLVGSDEQDIGFLVLLALHHRHLA